MQEVVTITSQGQLTIPVTIRRSFRITGQTKATIKRVGMVMVVEPKKDFWSLAGSLSSKVKLSDEQLKKARESFAKKWPKK